MKALERYVKKNSKAEPYGKSKAKGSWEGPEGVKEKGQYASKSGKKIVDDSKDYGETDPADAGMDAIQSIKSGGGKKGKQRSYLNC